jgi:signal transduction histidine kinase
MKKTKIFWYLLDSIFLIVFNLYFFLLKGIEQPASVWISYGSIHLAYLMLLITPSFVRKGSVSADYGRPLFVITTSYFFLALIVGVVFIALSPESITVALLVQVTIAAIFAILLLINLIANEHTADNVERREAELKYVKEASSQLHSLVNQLSDKKLQKLVEKAYDLIHSSQVKSSIKVQTIEQDVFNEISVLTDLVKNKKFESIEDEVNKICNLAEERNRQLKLIN